MQLSDSIFPECKTERLLSTYIATEITKVALEFLQCIHATVTYA